MIYLLRRRKLVFELFLIVFVGGAVAAALIRTSTMNPKWLDMLIFGALASTGLSIFLPHRERILILISGFLLPLAVNIVFSYKSVGYTRQINGFMVSAFDVVFALLLLEWLYRLIANYRMRISFFPQITIPFFLIVIFCIAGLYPVDTTLTIKISAIWKLSKCWLVIIYVANNIDSQEKIYIVVGAILLSGLFQGLVGIGQYITNAPLGLEFLGERTSFWGAQEGVSRVGGTIGHPNKLALFLCVLLQLNISTFFARFPKNSKWYLRLMYLPPFIPMLFTLLVSYSRGGWFSFLLGGVINCSWCMGRRTGKQLLAFVLVFGSFACLAVMIFLLVEPVRNRILMDDKGSGEVRGILAQVAWNIIEEKPWLGIGLNNYATCYPEYDDTEFAVSVVFPEMVHNEFLLIVAEIGIPGFLCFIYILCWLFFTLWRISRIEYNSAMPYLAIGFFCGLVGWCIHNQKEYQYVFFATGFWFHIGVILAMKSFLEKEKRKIQTCSSVPSC